MNEAGAWLWIWLVHALVAGLLSAPIVFFSRKYVHWHLWELVALVLPFALWSMLFCSELSTGRKSLANLAEPLFIALAVPAAALIRVGLNSKIQARTCAILLIGCLTALAAVIFFVVPPLPE